MNPKLNTKPAIISRVGTFWINQTSKESPTGLPLVRSLSRLVDHGNFDLRIFDISSRLANSTVFSYNVDHRFEDEHVTVIPSGTGDFYINDTNELVDFTTGTTITESFDWAADNSLQHFVIRVPLGFKPVTIFTQDCVLAEGTAFTSGDGYIRLFVSPFTFFPDNLICCKLNKPKLLNSFDYTIQVDDVYSGMPLIAKYLRENHSLKSFEMALNELVGRVILKSEGVVVEIIHIEKFGVYIYVFDNDTHVRVSYAHTPLELGEFYEAGTVIGKAVFVHQSPSAVGAISSWVNDHLPDGLALNTINPNNREITIPNRVVEFLAEAGEVDGNHIRIALDGTEEDLDAYFSVMHRNEDLSSYYLNHILELDVDETVRLNAIQFYIQHIFRDKLVLVKFADDSVTIPQYNRVRRFVKDNTPLGAILSVIEPSGLYVADGALWLDDSSSTLGLGDTNSYLVLF